jgi:ADP-dependent NAD(P)H-hydrate dehydratase / NAD(P)H-hydrate epimerase
VSLRSWLEPLLDAELMRATDRWAIDERGVPARELMERAGEGLARMIAEVAPEGRIAVVCGKGNNGGDGLVAVRLLRQAGRDVEALCVWEPRSMSEDAQAQVRALPGPRVEPFEPERLKGAQAVVDALLGTGFTGAPREPLDGVIEAINAARAPVIAADVPSGVDASTGEVAGAAVRAVATATFHRAKPGLWIHPGKAHAGAVQVIGIGIPRGAPGDPCAGLIRPTVLDKVPDRLPNSTKFSSGTVHVIGGSRGLTGAPTMAALGAMRAGAGYVTVAAPASLEMAFAVALLEPMFVPLPEEDGALTPDAVGPALKAIRRADAVVLGPGFGRTPGALECARELARRIDIPLVVDADGLNALAEDLDGTVPHRRWPTVLTPHAGELGRLLDIESAEVGSRRLHHARGAAARTKAVVVLKGDDTIVANSSGKVAISPGGAPGLATAGTGDVLSGVIAALLAKGLQPAHAASAGVYVHQRAGQLAAEPHGPNSVIASDVIAALPAAFDTRTADPG